MEWYEAEVAQLERVMAQKRFHLSPVAFYGSSSIRMWETLAEDLVSNRVLNLGFGGKHRNSPFALQGTKTMKT